jgi:hypothetical protein
MVENKGKLIQTEIFPSVQKHDIYKYLDCVYAIFYSVFTIVNCLISRFYRVYSSIKVLISIYKYYVSCTDSNISVGVNYTNYLFFHRRPTQQLCLFPVGLSLLSRHFQQVLYGDEDFSVSWPW